jgi:hypothetical protein
VTGVDPAALPVRRVARVMSSDAAGELMGGPAPELAASMTEAGLLVDEASSAPLLAYYPLDPADVAPLRAAVLRIKMSDTFRATSGSRNASRTFGMAPRHIIRGRESCRPTTLALDQPTEHGVLVTLAGKLQAHLEAFAPGAFVADVREMGAVREDWRIADGSLWTSGVVNRASALPYHRDRLNFDTWSAMPVVRRGMAGGHLHLPEFGVTIGCRDGWVVTFPGHRFVHGVTPMRATAPDGYRFSVVYYALRGMKDCWSYAVELGEARRRRTEREAHAAAVLTGAAPSKVAGRRSR